MTTPTLHRGGWPRTDRRIMWMQRLGGALALVVALSPRVQAGPPPTGALIYCGSSGCILPTTGLTASLTAAGATQVDTVTALPALDPYRLVFVMDPAAGITADEPALQAFHQGGGTLVLVGECAQWNGMANATIDDLLAQIGSSLSIVTASDYPDSSCSMYVATGSQSSLMANVTAGLRFAWTSRVTATDAQTIASYDGEAIVAGDLEQRIVVAGDANIFLDTCSFAADGNLGFFTNLWKFSAPGGGGSGTGTGSGSGDSSSASGCSATNGGAGVGGGLALLFAIYGLRRRGMSDSGAAPCDDADEDEI